MIKTIIFDNNGVLTYSDKERTISNFSRYFEVEDEKMREVFDEFAKPMDDGSCSTFDFHSNLARHFSRTFDPKELRKVHINSYQPKPEMRNLLEKIKQDFEIALLTNLEDIFDEASERLWHYDELFDENKIFVSCKMKMKKPNMNIYKRTLKELGRKPGETVFVDDREANLVSPQKLGMNVILFKEPISFKEEIFRLTGKNYA